MKNLALFALLMRVCNSNALTNRDGEVVLDTPTLKWMLHPSDACYFQAYKLNECWIYPMDYDLDVCVECMVEGQSDPTNPSCTDIDLETIKTCSDSVCYGGYDCNARAMEFFTCMEEECSQDPYDVVLPTANEDGDAIDFDTPLIKWEFLPSDACYFQAYKLDECWIYPMDYDLGACVECVLEGQSDPMNSQSDPMNLSSIDIDLETIKTCSDSMCYGGYDCNARAMQFFSCVAEECNNDPPYVGGGNTGGDDDEDTPILIWQVYPDGSDDNDFRCIDLMDANTQPGNYVWYYPCNFSPAQYWYWDPYHGEHYVRSSIDESKCLTTDGGSTELGTRLIIDDCPKHDQRFMWDYWSSGSIRPRNNGDVCIELSTEDTGTTGMYLILDECHERYKSFYWQEEGSSGRRKLTSRQHNRKPRHIRGHGRNPKGPRVSSPRTKSHN